jgi:hypothetical protein
MKSGVVLLAIGLLAGGAACKARHTSSTGQTHASSPALSWRDSERMVYRVSLSSRMQPASDTSPVTLTLSGQLELRTRVAVPMSRLLASLTGLSVQAGGEGGTTAPPDLLRELQQPWGFDLEEGRLHQIRAASGASAFAQSILTTLAAAFQSPAEANQNHAISCFGEPHPLGEHVALDEKQTSNAAT